MLGSFLILIAASAAAGLAVGRVISRRARRFLLIGGLDAAVLGLVLAWLQASGVALPFDPAVAHVLALALLGVAAVLLPFWLAATWSGP